MHDFELIRTQTIESLGIEAREYRHRPTGAPHLHLAAQDSNNAFMVAFRTYPSDSTGVAHILEHTALCGSRRFPVRDPFFLMTRRSLNTFMNAFTGADWTAYPFASQNRKDFDNLLEVYLDAVFFPLLEALDFAQEGHRLEFENPEDTSSPLAYKGVVYNEMKGALSSPTARLWHALHAELYPTATYHYNSGGDPEEIPNLTWQGLRDFHRRHYHPSNAYFATYGDFDPREHQQRFHDWALKFFEARPAAIAIADERRYSAPRTLTLPYACSPGDAGRDQSHIVLGWLLNRTTDLATMMELHLLAGVLLDHSASPLRHALETSALARAPSELCGIDSANREASFACGVEGSNPEHAEAVEELILGVIRKVAEQGVEPELAAAVLHQMELAQREIRGGTYPYGLQLIGAAVSTALHGGDPIAALAIDPLLERLHDAIRRPEFLKDLARRWLLENPHRVRVVMVPDQGLLGRQAEATRMQLSRYQSSLDGAGRTRILEQGQRLRERQERSDDPSILPSVGLADVPAERPVPQSRDTLLNGMPLAWFGQGTNGLVYHDILVSLPHFEANELGLLGLYSECVTEVGYGANDYLAAQAEQAAVSGGVSAHVLVRAGVQGLSEAPAFFRLSANCLARNVGKLAKLLHDTFFQARFDELERLTELIAQGRAARESAITDHGHALAMAAACAGFGPAAAAAQLWDGLAGLKRLKALDEALAHPEERRRLGTALASIHQRLADAPRQLVVVGEGKHREAIEATLTALWDGTTTPVDASPPFIVPVLGGRVREAWLTSTQVNFCARAYPTVPVDHPDAAPLLVLGRFLNNGYLHRAVREQGGAYGSGAAYDGDSGAFKLYSYRDPRLGETLDDFDAALDWLMRPEHPRAPVEEAILGVIAALDRPSSPAGEALKTLVARIFGRSPELLARIRRRVLEVTLSDLQRVAAAYLIPDRASTAIITSPSTLERYPRLDLEPQMI